MGRATTPTKCSEPHNAPAIARPQIRAFTLIELLIALALAGVLVATAAPSARALISAVELRERSEALVRSLSVARSEAIKRGTRVDVCPSSDRRHCASAATWAAGWLTFVNEAKAQQPPGDTAILSSEMPARAGIAITGNRPVADYISFTSIGHARRHDGALQMGTFTVCRRGQGAQKVVLANSGRGRLDITSEACS